MSRIESKNELLKDMIAMVLLIAAADPLHNVSSAAYRIARIVLRKNLMRIQAVYLLNSTEKLSDCALELARNMIEDTISLSYILSDPVSVEATAESFFSVQACTG